MDDIYWKISWHIPSLAKMVTWQQKKTKIFIKKNQVTSNGCPIGVEEGVEGV